MRGKISNDDIVMAGRVFEFEEKWTFEMKRLMLRGMVMVDQGKNTEAKKAYEVRG